MTNVAFVVCGSTGLLSGAGGGVASSISPELYDALNTFTRDGVGVKGGILGAVLELALLRDFKGVTGPVGRLKGDFSGSTGGSCLDFLLPVGFALV